MNRHVSARRAAAIALAAVALVVGPASPATGASSGGDTSAVAINTKDGSSVFKLAFEIRRVTGEVVDNQNAAVAYASCTECQTVAISIQVLLIAGTPDTVTPENIAVALNENCTLCQTMASAYQFAVGVGTKTRFTPEGSKQIAELRRRLQDLRKSGKPIADIQAEVDAITADLAKVLSTELVAVAPKRDKGEEEDEEDDDEPTETTTSTTPTTTTSPPTTTSPTSTAAPTPTPAPTTSTTPGGTTPPTTTTAPTTSTPTQTTPTTTAP